MSRHRAWVWVPQAIRLKLIAQLAFMLEKLGVHFINQKGLSLFLHTANKIIVHAKPVRRKLEYLPVVATV